MIKFRAWDKKGKAYINGFNMIGFSTGQGAPEMKLQRYDSEWSMDDIILEEFTGLTDREGTEVYEGDVVDYNDTEGKYYKSEIRWNEDLLCWNFNEMPYKTIRESGYFQGMNLEVIGHIHTEPINA